MAFVLLILQALSEIIKSYSALSRRDTLFKVIAALLLFALLSYLGVAYEWDYIVEPLLLMLFGSLAMLMAGFHVAFVFAGVALYFALVTKGMGFLAFEMLPYRIYGIMDNVTLV